MRYPHKQEALDLLDVMIPAAQEVERLTKISGERDSIKITEPEFKMLCEFSEALIKFQRIVEFYGQEEDPWDEMAKDVLRQLPKIDIRENNTDQHNLRFKSPNI